MFTVVRESKAVYFTLASNQFFVQPLIRRFDEIAREWGVDNATDVDVVLRELLFNAIIHGNHNQQCLLVYCRIERAREGVIRIVVQDEGDGFDLSCLGETFPEASRTSRGRGYLLIRNLCRELKFNASGNRVSVLVDTVNGKDDKWDAGQEGIRGKGPEQHRPRGKSPRNGRAGSAMERQ
jgi:serine/threonine-protein kinase RsbW